MDSLEDILGYELYGINVASWIAALAAAGAVFLFLVFLRGLARRKVKSGKPEGTVGKLAAYCLSRTSTLLLAASSLYAVSHFLELPDRFMKYFYLFFILLLLIQLGMWGAFATTFLIEDYVGKKSPDPASLTTVSALGLLLKLVLWSVVLLLVLENFGVNITALVTGLGIGGVAVALAAQNILGDLFASAAIVLDKPFVIGDFITVDGYMGAVEHIGVKTTRIRSLTGEMLVFSNSDLIKSRIRNYERMKERRVEFNIYICHDTPVEKVKEVSEGIREIISPIKNVRFDRAHFYRYENFGLNFDVVYYIASPDYGLYMEIQQDINLQIHRRLGELGVRFAVSTQPCAPPA